MAQDDLQLLTTAEVASLLRLAKRTLEEMRIAGTGPNYIKSTLGRRGVVRYRPSDIIKWIERQSVRTEQDSVPSKVDDDKPPISDLLSDAEGLMTARETAVYLRINYATLTRMRLHREGPKFIKTGKGPRSNVVYRKRDIATWLEQRQYEFTAQYSKDGRRRD